MVSLSNHAFFSAVNHFFTGSNAAAASGTPDAAPQRGCRVGDAGRCTPTGLPRRGRRSLHPNAAAASGTPVAPPQRGCRVGDPGRWRRCTTGC